MVGKMANYSLFLFILTFNVSYDSYLWELIIFGLSIADRNHCSNMSLSETDIDWNSLQKGCQQWIIV